MSAAEPKDILFLALFGLSMLMIQPGLLAQKPNHQITIAGGVQSSIALGQYSDQTGGTIFGFGGSFLVPTWRNSPFQIGFGYGWKQMRTVLENEEAPKLYDGLSAGHHVLETTRHTFDALLRFNPFNGRVQPFLEGVGGWSYYPTQSVLDLHNANGEVTEVEEQLLNEGSLNYGWGVGLQIRLLPHVFLEGKMQRIYATEKKVIDRNTLNVERDGSVNHDTLKVAPEFITLMAGLTIKF